MKKKLIYFFFWIAKTVQQDKLLHNKFGNLIAFIFSILSISLGINLIISGLIGLLMATLVGVIKDFWFDTKVQNEKSDIHDVLATSLGGFEVFLIEIFIYFLI